MRELPERPSLRFLKLEAKRRLTAGEFPTLHDAQLAVAREHGFASWTALKQHVDGHALTQLRWVLSRFDSADTAGWVAPTDDEMRLHFDDHALTLLSPAKLAATLAGMAADLRQELVVTANEPLLVQARIAGRQVRAAAEPEPPHRLTGLRFLNAGGPVSDSRVAEPVTRTHGPVPPPVVAMVETAFTEFGLPGLVLACGDPDGTQWTVTTGWADLDRGQVLNPEHRFPLHTADKLLTAVAVLRLVADGRIELTDDVRALLTHTQDDGVFAYGHAGYAELAAMISNTTGLSYVDSIAELVLAPLDVSGSGRATGYQPTPQGRFEQVSPGDGLWLSAVGLLKLGLRWQSLLPEELAAQAISPLVERRLAGGHAGFGWLIDRTGELAGHAGNGPGAAVSLVRRLVDGRTFVAMANRQVGIEPVIGRAMRELG